MNARYYDGSRGQFISQDPQFWNFDQAWLLDPQNQNSYSYARNNPIGLSDPSGECAIMDYIKNIWNKFIGNNTSNVSVQNVTTNTNPNYVQNNNTQNIDLGSNSWGPQLTPTGCLDKCSEMVGYHPNYSHAIQVREYDDNKNLNVLPNAKNGVQAIDQYLLNGDMIVVGVNRDIGKESDNSNHATQHYVTINGRYFEDGQTYYTFLDPGTSREEAGTSPNNRLYLNTNDYSLSGVSQYNHKNYKVTEVRPK